MSKLDYALGVALIWPVLVHIAKGVAILAVMAAIMLVW